MVMYSYTGRDGYLVGVGVGQKDDATLLQNNDPRKWLKITESKGKS